MALRIELESNESGQPYTVIQIFLQIHLDLSGGVISFVTNPLQLSTPTSSWNRSRSIKFHVQLLSNSLSQNFHDEGYEHVHIYHKDKNQSLKCHLRKGGVQQLEFKLWQKNLGMFAHVSRQKIALRRITPVVRVVGLVVHDQRVVDKVETVGFRFERLLDHILACEKFKITFCRFLQLDVVQTWRNTWVQRIMKIYRKKIWNRLLSKNFHETRRSVELLRRKLLILLTELWVERRKFVNVLARIFGVRYAKSIIWKKLKIRHYKNLTYDLPKIKIERLQELVAEKMAFDHPKFVHRLRTDGEFDTVKILFRWRQRQTDQAAVFQTLVLEPTENVESSVPSESSLQAKFETISTSTSSWIR